MKKKIKNHLGDQHLQKDFVAGYFVLFQDYSDYHEFGWFLANHLCKYQKYLNM